MGGRLTDNKADQKDAQYWVDTRPSHDVKSYVMRGGRGR